MAGSKLNRNENIPQILRSIAWAMDSVREGARDDFFDHMWMYYSGRKLRQWAKEMELDNEERQVTS